MHVRIESHRGVVSLMKWGRSIEVRSDEVRSDKGRSDKGRVDGAIRSFMYLGNVVSYFLLVNEPGWLGQKASQHFAPLKYVLSMMGHASKL